jgi:hypothetical protein
MGRTIALDFLFAATVFILILTRIALIVGGCREDIAHNSTSFSILRATM